MKTPPLETIKSLIPSMTDKDQKIAERLITSRDFEGLKELVDSGIIRARKSLNSENPKEEYLKLDMEKLEELRVAVNGYLKYFDFGNEEDDSYDDGLSDDDLDLLGAVEVW